MRIGVMLRTLDEQQGTGVYTQSLIPWLLRLDPATHYVLIHPRPRADRQFARFPNATSIALPALAKPFWDQVAVPWVARRYGLDLVFHPKFTVPLLCRCPTVMVLHGSDWFTYPEHYRRLDVAYVRLFMPWYCRKAAHLISVSEQTTRDFVRRVGVPREKITTIPLAADECFRRVDDEAERRRIRRKYGLPARFLLTVTNYSRQKNVPALLRAHARLPARLRLPLVLVGVGVERFVDDLGWRSTDRARDIVTPGWVEHEDLPALYSTAAAFALPSRYEGFGLPALEAMRCGCPVIASTTGALPEITADAAELVDPTDEGELTRALRRVLENPARQEAMRQRGLARARHFRWEDHARRTLAVLHGAARRQEEPRPAALVPAERER